MYLAWSMTYFHINLDPRGKKKSFAANSYTRDYIGFLLLLFLWIFWVPFFVLFCLFCFFLSGLSKTRLQGGAWGEITLQFLRGPLGFRFRLRRPAESPLRGGLPSSSACTVVFRCSMLTPVLFQNTSVECVSLCAQEHTPFNIVPACLPALSTSVVMSLTCLDRTSLFITVLFLFFLFSSRLCVNVHVSLFSICVRVWIRRGNFVGVLKEPHISKKATKKLKRKRNVGDGIKDRFSFHLHTVLLTLWLKDEDVKLAYLSQEPSPQIRWFVEYISPLYKVHVNHENTDYIYMHKIFHFFPYSKNDNAPTELLTWWKR